MHIYAKIAQYREGGYQQKLNRIKLEQSSANIAPK